MAASVAAGHFFRHSREMPPLLPLFLALQTTAIPTDSRAVAMAEARQLADREVAVEMQTAQALARVGSPLCDAISEAVLDASKIQQGISVGVLELRQSQRLSPHSPDVGEQAERMERVALDHAALQGRLLYVSSKFCESLTQAR